jgi:hypothetical protein
MKGALEPQDLLYTVVERDAEADVARVVGTLDATSTRPTIPRPSSPRWPTSASVS